MEISRAPSECNSRSLGPEQTAAMIACLPRPFYIRTDSREEKIYLRFASHIWNASIPGTQRVTSSPPKLILKLSLNAAEKRKRIPPPIDTEGEPIAKVAKHSPKQRKQCKVKVTRFQYGGPDAKVGGKYQNMITLLEPCLQPTCTNCWKWHAHLMRTKHHFNNTDVLHRPTTSPRSPFVDSKIVNDQWQLYQSRRDSTINVPGLTVPSVSVVDAVSSTPSLTPAVSSKTRWRESPSQGCAARLISSTDGGGRAKFKALAREQARREIKRKQDGLEKLQQKLKRDIQEHFSRDGVEAKRRRRHRLKLVFKTRKGKNGYRRLTAKYLQK